MKKGCFTAIGLLLLVSGCSGSDADHLASIGRKTVSRGAALAAKNEGGLADSLQVVRAGLDDITLDARVSARLRWDKALLDTPIQVKASGGVVELKGTVKDLVQRRRAVDLAENTAGVEKVVDALEMPGKTP